MGSFIKWVNSKITLEVQEVKALIEQLQFKFKTFDGAFYEPPLNPNPESGKHLEVLSKNNDEASLFLAKRWWVGNERADFLSAWTELQLIWGIYALCIKQIYDFRLKVMPEDCNFSTSVQWNGRSAAEVSQNMKDINLLKANLHMNGAH